MMIGVGERSMGGAISYGTGARFDNRGRARSRGGAISYGTGAKFEDRGRGRSMGGAISYGVVRFEERGRGKSMGGAISYGTGVISQDQMKRKIYGRSHILRHGGEV